MKVLQVINSLATGGAEKLLLDTIPKYKNTAIQVDLLVLNGTEFPFYLDFKKKHPKQLFSLGKSSVYHPILIFKIIKYFKKYDVIHVHLFPALYWIAIAKMISFSSVKLIYTEHSTGNRRNNNLFFQLFDKLIYAQYTTIICVTNEVKVHLINKLHQSDSKFVVIENGIDLSEIMTTKGYKLEDLHLEIPQNAKIILQVSSFQPPKDQITVIKSLSHLSDNIHLLLAGQGPLMDDCKLLTQQLQLTKRVHFLGVRMDVLKLLKTADIIVLSSGFEGLSLSCIEGLASGKPFVASDVKGLHEMVDGVGVLFPFQDDKALAQIVNELLSDNQKYEITAQKGMLKAQQYDNGMMIEKHVDVYMSL
jgi:glycosyltransferase involved in cell wall biosynthesis